MSEIDVVIKRTAFDYAFAFTVLNEGGFSNNKNDKGGATNYGITIDTLSRWRGRAVSTAEVKAMGLTEAKAIYDHWYWLPLGLDNFVHTGSAMAAFDMGVLQGIGTVAAFIQQVCNDNGGNLVKDGHIGPKTLERVNALSNDAFVTDFKRLCDMHFQGIVSATPSQHVFLQGWLNRSNRLLSLANMPDLKLI